MFLVSFLAGVFVQSNEARCKVENEDVVGTAPTGGGAYIRDLDSSSGSIARPVDCVVDTRLVTDTFIHVLHHMLQFMITIWKKKISNYQHTSFAIIFQLDL